MVIRLVKDELVENKRITVSLKKVHLDTIDEMIERGYVETPNQAIRKAIITMYQVYLETENESASD